jgi:hypothetical protein
MEVAASKVMVDFEHKSIQGYLNIRMGLIFYVLMAKNKFRVGFL